MFTTSNEEDNHFPSIFLKDIQDSRAPILYLICSNWPQIELNVYTIASRFNLGQYGQMWYIVGAQLSW